MVARVAGDEDACEAAALGETGGGREHDAVAEGYDRRLHVVEVIFAVWDGVGAFEQRAVEVLADKRQVDFNKLDAELPAVEPRHLNLAGVVV